MIVLFEWMVIAVLGLVFLQNAAKFPFIATAMLQDKGYLMYPVCANFFGFQRRRIQSSMIFIFSHLSLSLVTLGFYIFILTNMEDIYNFEWRWILLLINCTNLGWCALNWENLFGLSEAKARCVNSLLIGSCLFFSSMDILVKGEFFFYMGLFSLLLPSLMENVTLVCWYCGCCRSQNVVNEPGDATLLEERVSEERNDACSSSVNPLLSTPKEVLSSNKESLKADN